jgi:anti-sigma regulatory factor (Ser/Thr protein kinase)
VAGGRSPGWTGAEPGPAGSADGHVHTAAVVSSAAGFLSVALPFLDEGCRAGDLVVLACSPEGTELLRRELGGRAVGMESAPQLCLPASRAPDSLGSIRALLGRAAGTGSGRLRILGEARFGAAPRSSREGQRYESALNVLLAGAPLTAMCTYDREVLPAEVVDSARATHPHLVVDGVAQANPAYQNPRSYLAQLPLPREPMEDGDPVFAVDGADALAELRHRLAAVLATVVPDRDQREDLHLAVSEIAANAFRHGVPPVAARVWATADRVVCTIRDRGTRYGDALSGFQPAHGADLSRGGMGLWLARKLWDHVDLLPGLDGLTVRLSCALR